MTSISLEAMLTSPASFGLASASPLQRALCRIADGAPLGQLAEHPHVLEALGGQDAVAALAPGGARPAELVLLAAIRTGKSMMAAAAALTRALTCDLSGLAPGEIPRVVVVSLTLDLAQVVFRHIVGTMSARPKLRALLLGEPTSDSAMVRHPSGRPVEIKVLPLARAGSSIVARWLVALILDEAPRMIGADDGVKNMSETRNAAIGRLLPGGQMLAIGSPWAPFGPIYEMVQESWGKPSERLVVVRAPGPRMNPAWWTEARCERMRVTDPAAYQTDVLGEFSDPESGLLAVSDITVAQRTQAGDLEPEPPQHYVAAMDPGTRGNAWTLVVGTARPIDGTARTRTSVVLTRQWVGSPQAPLSPKAVLADIAGIVAPYGIRQVWTDQYQADALRDLARDVGMSLVEETITAARRLELFELLRVRFSAGEIDIPPDPVLRADLLSVRRRVTQSGVTIVLPHTSDGRHADYAAALALLIAVPTRRPDVAHAHVDEAAQMRTSAVQRSSSRLRRDWWQATWERQEDG